MHLVDTNVLSELMRPAPDRRASSWAAQQERFLVSVITLEEVWYGLSMKRSGRLERWFEAFVEDFCDTADVTREIARSAAQLRASTRAKGKPRTQADMMIAATALVHGAVLVTRNTKDFEGCGVRLLNPFSR